MADMKKPLSVWAGQAVLACVSLMRALNAFACLGLILLGTSIPALVGLIINSALAVVAGWLLRRSIWRRLKLTWLIVFLVVDLIAYPLSDLLTAEGWYPVGSPALAVFGPVLAAALHYVPLLAVIFWLGFSKDTKRYLSVGQ